MESRRARAEGLGRRRKMFGACKEETGGKDTLWEEDWDGCQENAVSRRFGVKVKNKNR